jgi:hypothetical protein
MEFFIRKNATLPVLKMQVVKDGRAGYQELMETLELSTIYFSMINEATGIAKIVSSPCSIVSLIQADGAPTEYYIYYQFTSRDTNTPGRYVGQFLIKQSGLLGTQQGNLIVPIREQLYINVEDSFISESPCC